MYRNQLSSWGETHPAPGSHAAGAGGSRDKGMDGWIAGQERVAWREMVRNVGPAAGAADGAVVASPSKGQWEDEPDYYVS